MRTLNDLDAVFATLEQQVDEYQAASESAPSAKPDEVFALHHPAARATHRRRGVLLTAAVVAAGLAFGSWQFVRVLSNDSGQPGGSDWTPTSRALHFSIRPSSGLEVVAADGRLNTSLGEGGELATVGGPHGRRYYVEIEPARPDLNLNFPNATKVDVQGHDAYYGCWRISDASGCDVLAWQYATDAWVMVSSEGRSAPVSELQTVAESLDLNGVTQLKAPISFAAAPRGLRLYELLDDYPTPTRDWQYWVQYTDPNDEDNGLAIHLDPGTIKPWSQNDESVTVDGHPGYWSSLNAGTLILQLADDVQLSISAWENGPAMDLTEATTIVRSIRLAPQADDQSTWFPVLDALPD
jgi:hypothetical protein